MVAFFIEFAMKNVVENFFNPVGCGIFSYRRTHDNRDASL